MSSIDVILQKNFGLSSFRAQQRAVIEDVLAQRDVLCVMPTGAGKSLCFQLPAVAMGGLAIVVTPLISLMADQALHMRRLKIPTLVLNSAQPYEAQAAVMSELRQGFNGLLYIAPERFTSAGFQRIMTKLRPRLFAVDEAHCVSFWGHDFRPEYKRLAEFRNAMGNPTTIAVTATATRQVQKDIVEMLGLARPRIHVTGFDRPNLSYSCRGFEKNADKRAALIRFLDTHAGSGIIYCATRKTVDELGAALKTRFAKRGVAVYHAGMEAAERKLNQLMFMGGEETIAVATNAFGMGIDKPKTRFVAHYNLPGSLEAYYQEAGRAGRDGEPAACLLYHSGADLRTQRFFIDRIGENNRALTPEDVKNLRRHASRNLNLMLEYAEERSCRRRQILEYFGEQTTKIAGCSCDVCQGRLEITPDERMAERREEVRRKAGQSGRVKRTAMATLDEEGMALLEKLRELRRAIALESKTPAFMVLHDATLVALAREKPHDMEELMAAQGIGPHKAEKYGARILQIIADA